MFAGTVEKHKRGLFGRRWVVVFHAQGIYPEPIIAEMSKYDNGRYRKTWHDYTESHGDYRDPSDGVVEYDLDSIPDDVEPDHVDLRAGRAYVVKNVDEDLPF